MDRFNGNVSSTNNRRDIKRSMSKEQRSSPISNNKEILSKQSSIGKQDRSSLLDRFIFEYKFNIWKIRFFKFMFYMMMAIDFWLEIPRSAKFWVPSNGADRFINQSHFPVEFDSMMKSIFSVNSVINEQSFIYSTIIAGLLSIRCAFSMNITYLEPFLIALFKGYMVLSSQADNYQHHYLLVLVLFLLSTINWNALLNKKNNNNMVSCWQLKLLIIQLSVVYFWTTIAKLHLSWINGSVLPRMVGPEFKEFINGVIEPLIENYGGTYSKWLNPMSIISCSTIVVELFLVVSLHIKQLSLLNSLLGISMHTLMGSSGLRIGTFSYFMVIFYILTLPDGLFKFLPNVSTETTTTTTNWNIKFKLLSSLVIGIIGTAFSIGIFKIKIFSIHWWFFEYFKNSFLIIVSIMVIQNLTKSRNNSVGAAVKQISFLILVGILVGILSNSRIEFRETFIERGTMSIKLNLIDDSINNYLIAKEISEDYQYNELPFETMTIYQENQFEFIGDLGLFLETKNNQSLALEIYEKYYEKFPNILKIHAGLIRCLSVSPRNKSKICNLLPKTLELAKTISTLDNCHSIECGRNKGHANYVLDLINKTKKNFNNCL